MISGLLVASRLASASIPVSSRAFMKPGGK
jgi:hypothetical protein